jgi:hypothetical protein
MNPKSLLAAGLRAAFFTLAPLGLFLTFFNVRILDPSNVGWLLKGDWGQHVLGWHAFRHSPWTWPPAHNDLLAWPGGTELAYTDSNPLISFLLKPLGPWLPENFQFIGPWFLLCLCLHVVLAWKLLRRHSPNPVATAAGALLLSALPTLYNRMGHDTLMAHWTILWAFWIYFEVEPPALRRRWWIAALVVTAMIHFYLLVMVGAVWASDMARMAAAGRRLSSVQSREPWLKHAVVSVLGVLAAFAASGLFSGATASAGGFGLYSMGLDAPFNPVFDTFSFFVRAHPLDEGQAFEGYQYLGAGLLLLIAVAAAACAASADVRRAVGGKAWWLAPTMMVLILLAISNFPQIYDRPLFRIPLPGFIEQATGVLRSSGRLFWPAAYLLVLLSLRAVFALPARAATGAVVFVLAVQAVDLTPFARVMRSFTADAGQRGYSVAADPRWDRLIEAARLVEFQSDIHADEPAFIQIAWRSVLSGRPIDKMYVARQPERQRLAEQAEAEDFKAGRLQDDRLYVMLDGCPAAVSGQGRMRSLDGVNLVAPKTAAGLRLDGPAAVILPAQPLMFTSDSAQAPCGLGAGWSAPEPAATWSDGPQAAVSLHLRQRPDKLVLINITAAGFPASGQHVVVLADGKPAGEFDLTGAFKTYDLVQPIEAWADGRLDLTFLIRSPTAPGAGGASNDPRRLGMALRSIQVGW